MRIRVALIGSSHVMLQSLKKIPSTVCHVVGISEIEPDQPDPLKLTPTIPLYENFRSMISKTTPEAVIICFSKNPKPELTSIVEYCAQKGIALFFEEHLAPTLTQASAFARLIQHYSVPALIGNPRRFSAQISYAKELLSSGIIGRPIRGTVLWSAQVPHDYFGTDIPVQSYSPKREYAGYDVLDISSEIDNLRYLFGEIKNMQAALSPSTSSFIFQDSRSLSIQFSKDFVIDFFIAQTLSPPVLYQKGKNMKAYGGLYNENCFYVFGTKGSVCFPTFEVSLYQTECQNIPSNKQVNKPQPQNPYVKELLHFCDIVDRCVVEPFISVDDGLGTLVAINQLQKDFGVKEFSNKNNKITDILLSLSPLYSRVNSSGLLEIGCQLYAKL